MTKQQNIEDIVERVRTGGPRLVYLAMNEVVSCEAESDRANRILKEHASLVVGVYDRKVKPSDLREDIEFRMRERRFIEAQYAK